MSRPAELKELALQRDIRNLRQGADYADELARHHLTTPEAADRHQAGAALQRAGAAQKQQELDELRRNPPPPPLTLFD